MTSFSTYLFSPLKDYIARFGHGSAKLARQAQSKEKTLNRMVENGLTEKVTVDRVWIKSFSLSSIGSEHL